MSVCTWPLALSNFFSLLCPRFTNSVPSLQGIPKQTVKCAKTMADVGNCNVTCKVHVMKLGNFCLKMFLILLVFYSM